MSILLILFLAFSVLSLLTIAHGQYCKCRHSKAYTLQKNVQDIVSILVMIPAAHLMLLTKDGEDSPWWWWLLSYSAAALVSALLQAATLIVCKRVWRTSPPQHISVVKTPRKIAIFGYVAGITIELVTVCFFCFFFFTQDFTETSETIIFALVTALFLTGAYFQFQELRRILK